MQENRTIRFILLVILIFLINTWTAHHFGSAIWKLSIANGFVILIAVGKFVLKTSGGTEAEEIKGAIQRISNFFYKLPVLVILYCLFFIASLVVTSVNVLSSGWYEEVSVALSNDGREAEVENCEILSAHTGSVRFIRFTTPFGRPQCLNIKGFVPYFFDLYPLTGKTVRLTQDLQVAPSVLIRIPTKFLSTISKAELEVMSDGMKPIKMKCQGGKGGILVGRDITIPASFIDRWQMELLAAGTTDRAQTARSLLAWRNPLKVEPESSLMPGMQIEARLTLNDSLIAWAQFRLGDARIQDIKMIREVLSHEN